MDTAMFFPARGEDTMPAKLVCAICPVCQPCLDYAMRTNERWGIWGGKSERERRRLRRTWTGQRQRGVHSPFEVDRMVMGL
jgi:WhiB family redox-sensing transcriptional regulator